MADRLPNRVGYQQLRPEFLVEALDSGGQIHRVADHGVFLAPRRADVACHHLPKMQSYANAQRPITADIVLLNRGKHFARGRDGAPWRVGIVERRTKQRRKPSPRNLFTMPPLRSTMSTSTVNAASNRSTTSCGVRLRAAAVKPRMSTNMTATCRVSLLVVEPAASRRSTTWGETCWPNRLVTKSRAVAAAILASNCRRSCTPTAPARTPQAKMTALREIRNAVASIGSPTLARAAG